MKEQFIPYELALKLKELGFNEGVLSFYKSENDYFFDGNGYNTWVDVKDNPYLGVKRKEYIPRPLWQQAFDWILNKYDLYMPIHRCIENGQVCFTVTGGTFGVKLTYLEARRACLEKLIKIIEEKLV